MRLNQLLSLKNITSRRQADEWIKKSWVKVNKKIITEMGAQVSEKDLVEISAKAFAKQKITLILNKPTGYVSMPEDPNYPSAYELLKTENQYLDTPDSTQAPSFNSSQLSVCGRLDQDSHGLLLLTEDPVLVKKIIGEHSKVQKQYIVTVTGEITNEKVQKLCFGLSIEGQKLRPAEVKQISKNKLDFTLKEGKKRQIRRMCGLVGLQVQDLQRIRIGSYTLNHIPLGKWLKQA